MKPSGGALSVGAALVLAASMVGALPAAEWLRPTQRTSASKGSIDLATQIPDRFGEWREDTSIVPLLPDAGLQATLDATYSQVLARTYVNPRRQHVMLSIAYGNDQNSEATAVHRPEFCYRTQGFTIRDAGSNTLALPDSALRVQRLVGTLSTRFEPITYWITLDETATLPGFSRKLEQMRYGLRGLIADGMIVRVSTVGFSEPAAFEVQNRFIADLNAAVPRAVRARYFGS